MVPAALTATIKLTKANCKTYQAVNYILMLKEDIAQRANPQTDNQNLCLLIVYNSPLIMAWAETMNNGKFMAPQFAE